MLKMRFVVPAILLFVMTGCLNPQAGDVPFTPPYHRKEINRPLAGDLNVAIYIDVETQNPLNVGDYILEDGRPYFDFVILGAARMMRPAGGRDIVLYLPPGLQHVLNNRHIYIDPLRRMGIRVLLSIKGGGDDVSFGNVREQEDDDNPALVDATFFLRRFARTINDHVAFFMLDGVELFDTGGARLPPNRYTYPYPDGSFEGHPDMDRYPDLTWLSGGQQMSFLTLLIRQHQHMAFLQDTMIFIREINHGAHIYYEPSLFESRSSYVNFLYNNDFWSFGSSRQQEYGRFSMIPNADSDYHLYGPLSIDMGGLTPPVYCVDGNDIGTFSELLRDLPQNFVFLFYNGLLPSSEEDDRFLDTRPDSPTFGQRLTQADIMSITSEIMLGQRIEVRPGGGDHRATW